MIDYVVGGEYLNVTSSHGAMPYINMSNTSPMMGALAYDASSQHLKVYDGASWLTIGGGSATVNLSADAINILNWARAKMSEEAELNALCAQNPTIKDLVDQMNTDIANYQHKIQMVKNLLKEEEKIATS